MYLFPCWTFLFFFFKQCCHVPCFAKRHCGYPWSPIKVLLLLEAFGMYMVLILFLFTSSKKNKLNLKTCLIGPNFILQHQNNPKPTASVIKTYLQRQEEQRVNRWSGPHRAQVSVSWSQSLVTWRDRGNWENKSTEELGQVLRNPEVAWKTVQRCALENWCCFKDKAWSHQILHFVWG